MGKKRALVIDDEQIVLDSVGKILKEEGFDVYATDSSGGGISHGITESFDVILTDIRMPDIDGYKVVRDIRRFKPSVPIVVITGYADIRSAVEAMNLGATNYLEKPFTPEQLIRTVMKSIEDAADTRPEEQTLIHPKEVLKVLKKGASDRHFAERIFREGAAALEGYHLTSQEKLAFITADVGWIEDQIGTLQPEQKQWLTDGKKTCKQE